MSHKQVGGSPGQLVGLPSQHVVYLAAMHEPGRGSTEAGGRQKIRVSGGTRLFHQLTLVSIAATLSTALHCLDEQCSQCNTIYRTSFRTLMLQSILHYTEHAETD